jgi:aminopeptidase-like protein
VVKSHLGGLGVDRRIILIWIFNKQDGDSDMIDLARVSNKWLALVETTFVATLVFTIGGKFLD